VDLRQQRVLQSLRRVQAWCVANPGLVPAPVGSSASWSPLTRQLYGVSSIVTQMTEAAAQQGVQATQATLEASGEMGLRKHLRAELHVVTQVAQALRTTVPGIGVMKMPSTHMQAEALLKVADALRTQASPYEPVLVDHGLAPDFLAQLGDAISALRTSIDARGAARAGQVRATKQVALSIALGHQYVVIMDAALTKALRSNSAKLVEWKNAKRVTIKGVSASGIRRMATSSTTSTVTTPTLVADEIALEPPTPPSALVPIDTSGRDAKAA
jgi:hypothetical protein